MLHLVCFVPYKGKTGCSFLLEVSSSKAGVSASYSTFRMPLAHLASTLAIGAVLFMNLTGGFLRCA